MSLFMGPYNSKHRFNIVILAKAPNIKANPKPAWLNITYIENTIIISGINEEKKKYLVNFNNDLFLVNLYFLIKKNMKKYNSKIFKHRRIVIIVVNVHLL